MSGGLRTSVKGYLIAQRLAFTAEIDVVYEGNETIDSNLTGLQASDDKGPQDHPETSIALTSNGLTISDDGNLHSLMLSYAAKVPESSGSCVYVFQMDVLMSEPLAYGNL